MLVRDGLHGSPTQACVCQLRNRTKPSADSLPELVRTTIGPGGRVVIPAAYRKALEVKEGDYIVMHMDGEELRVVPMTRRSLSAPAKCWRSTCPKG